MTTPTPAVRAAEKIANSLFRPESTHHYAQELAQIITTEYAPMVEALEECRKAFERISRYECEVPMLHSFARAHDKAIADKALQLLKHTPEEDVHGHVAAIKHRMVLMTPEERESLMNELAETYCRHCWIMTNGETCHCTNDE